MSQRRVLPIVLSFVAMAGYQPRLIARQYDSDLFNEMHWRMIGPFRGGRTKAAAGIPSQPTIETPHHCSAHRHRLHGVYQAMAQEQPPPLQPHARPRSSIVLQSGLMLPLASVTRMDPSPVIPSRMGNAVKTGAVIGTTIGAAAGLVVGFILAGESTSPSALIAVITVAGAGTGAVVGALVGGIDAAASGSDSQADAPLDRLRMSVVAQRDGRFGLGMSVRF